MSLDPQSSASVGATLMALGQALAAALGPDHSETLAALNFR
jgi:hypothetical protein